MIAQHDPWAHRETGWSADIAAQSEPLLALTNGYLGMRGTLDEGAPAARPGTYLNGFYETLPIAYADRGFADPESDQVLAGVTDGTRIRLVVEGEPLDVRTGTVLEHERALDLRSGLLTRVLRWRSPAGHEIALRARRLVSLRHRELAAIDYEIQASRPLHISVHSELTTAVAGEGLRRPPLGHRAVRGCPHPPTGLPRRQPSTARTPDARQQPHGRGRHGPSRERPTSPRDDGPGAGIAGCGPRTP